MPIKSSGASPRTNSSPCQLARPPATGVPVPGAKAGSRPSMSKDKYTGASPARSSTISIAASMPLRCTQGLVRISKP